jgi:hypothetical protein
MHSAALERVQCRFNKRVVYADGGHLNLQFLDPKLPFYFRLDGVPGLGTQAAHALVGVIAGESSQIHAGNRPQKPCCLPFLFYGSSSDMGLNAALDRAGVDSDFTYPIEVEGNAGIREQRLSGERSNRTAAACSVWCEIPKLIVIDRHRVLSAK